MKTFLILTAVVAALVTICATCTPAETRRFEHSLQDTLIDSPPQPNNPFDNIGIGEGYEDNSVNPSPLITPKDPA